MHIYYVLLPVRKIASCHIYLYRQELRLMRMLKRLTQIPYGVHTQFVCWNSRKIAAYYSIILSFWLNFWFKSTGIKYMTFSHHIKNIYLEIRFRCRSLIQSSIVLCHHFPMHTLFLRFNFHSFSVYSLDIHLRCARFIKKNWKKKHVCSKTAKNSSVCSALIC